MKRGKPFNKRPKLFTKTSKLFTKRGNGSKGDFLS